MIWGGDIREKILFYSRIKAMHMVKKYKNWNFPFCEKKCYGFINGIKTLFDKTKNLFCQKKV